MRISLNVPGIGIEPGGPDRDALPTSAGMGVRRALLGGAALVLGLLGSSGAWAQCRDNFNYSDLRPPYLPAPFAFPLGIGATLSSFTSTINTINTAFLTSTSAFVSAPGGPPPDQQGGGAWSRVVAGTVETNTSSVGTLTGPPGAVPPGGDAKLRCQHTAELRWLPGRPRHIGPERWRHRCQLACRRDWRLLQACTKDTTPAGTFVNPNFARPSSLRLALSRGTRRFHSLGSTQRIPKET